MKKLILSVAAVFAFGVASAQDTATEGGSGFAKGDVFMTGAVNFSSSKYTADGNFKENGFTIAPSIGFFVTENIALGAGISYNSTSVEEIEGADETKTSTIGFEVMGRYYFTPANQFSVFGQLSVGYASTDFDAADVKVNGFGIGAAPGVSYFISDNFALEASWGVLSYASAKADVDGAEASNDFQFGLDLTNINFGLVYKF